ncbi:MAG: transposase [Oscillospiraceae bacterium]|nr:transposase [Oscillospiraceae bacterium]
MLYHRKSPRIPGYDYSRENYYFITVCCHENACIFGAVGHLNRAGEIAQEMLCALPTHYTDIGIVKFVVMPNHIHAIITIEGDNQRHRLDTIVGLYKSGVTREIRKIVPDLKVWQRSFHDHIIRNQQQYEKIWTYIDNNPIKWKLDCFYRE